MSSADVDRLVLAKRYELLLAGVGNLAGEETERLTNRAVIFDSAQRAH